MRLEEITRELDALERELRDLSEAIEDAPDIGAATRLRVQRRALLKRQEELQDQLVTILSAA